MHSGCGAAAEPLGRGGGDAVKQELDSSVETFNRDALNRGSYAYTDNRRLSSRMATRTSKELVMRIGKLAGRSVLDIGCGDGSFSIEYWDAVGPASLMGIDAAESAIDVANTNRGERPIRFQSGDAHRLPFPDGSFDLALLQSILHHDNDPGRTLREAFRVADRVMIHEPNGYNLGLKVIERVSPYHREHGERSYTLARVRRWIAEAGGRVEHAEFAGFVPMFCPDCIARGMKAVEPLVEVIPGVNRLACAVYVVLSRRLHPP
jgi:SAM-dependent methyltransferase